MKRLAPKTPSQPQAHLRYLRLAISNVTVLTTAWAGRNFLLQLLTADIFLAGEADIVQPCTSTVVVYECVTHQQAGTNEKPPFTLVGQGEHTLEMGHRAATTSVSEVSRRYHGTLLGDCLLPSE